MADCGAARLLVLKRIDSLSHFESSPSKTLHTMTSIEPPRGILLSLQDTCMLHIIFHLEKFPIETLALLPRAIRHKLFLSLSHADILHLDGTDLFRDISSRDRLSDARRALSNLLLLSHESDAGCPGYYRLAEFLSVDLKPSLAYSEDSVDRFGSVVDNLMTQHICKYYHSLEPSVIDAGISGLNAEFLPSRSLQFASVDQREVDRSTNGNAPSVDQRKCSIRFTSQLLEPLLQHCRMKTGPTELRIDYNEFSFTLLWKEYQDCLEQQLAYHAKYKDCLEVERRRQLALVTRVKKDPMIPLIQDFLSNVEVLELGSSINRMFADLVEYAVPYALLYNIVTTKQPRLKHLKFYGSPSVVSLVLASVAELLCSTTTPIFSNCNAELVTNTPPYLLEELSVSPSHYARCSMMTKELSREVSTILKSIIAHQLHNLKRVSISGVGLCCDEHVHRFRHVTHAHSIVPEYRDILSSTLTDLLKQPQVYSVSITDSPLSEACELIEAFQCTPATHEQSLTITGIVDETGWEKWSKAGKKKGRGETEDKEQAITKTETRFSQNHPVPETNTQFKCLDLGLTLGFHVHQWPFSHHVLKLKRLKMNTELIDQVPLGMDIQVEHLTLSPWNPSYQSSISPCHLEKFINSNPALKQLEVVHPSCQSVSVLFPALNHCLSKLVEHGRGLQELQMKSVNFKGTNLKEFFTIVRDLSQRSGTVLLLSLHTLFSEDQKETLISLSEEFKENRIKKIVYSKTVAESKSLRTRTASRNLNLPPLHPSGMCQQGATVSSRTCQQADADPCAYLKLITDELIVENL